jgi:hypothetical protein
MARYAQPDMEGPFVEFLLKRLEHWHPDLVIPVGSPAGRFVVKYRDRLFPDTPVIYTGMDRRTLPPGPLQNATFVGESFNLAGLVEDIREMAPETQPCCRGRRRDTARAVLGGRVPSCVRAVHGSRPLHVVQRPDVRSDAGAGGQHAATLVPPPGAAPP